jgi:hypothetical protein
MRAVPCAAFVLAALVPATDLPAQRLPSVEWTAVGHAGNVLVEYTRSGLKRSADGTVTAFSRNSLVAEIPAARRQRIEALRVAGLSAQGYERYLRQVRRSEYDCNGRRVRSLAVTDYDEAGAVLAWASTEGPEAAWTTVPRGSIGAKLLDAVCAAAAP